MTDDRSEIVAARATGIGIGLIVLMVVWLVASRVGELLWDPPVGPTIAFAFAIASGIVTSVVAATRLVRRVREDA